jgi:sugar/nucleoside kinase (ribokinase family)
MYFCHINPSIEVNRSNEYAMKRIIGIGNALTDVLVRMENDELLTTLGLPKGSMQLIDEQLLPVVRTAMASMEVSKATGGSAGNTMLALANLDVAPGFIGKIGDDDFGRFYAANASARGIQPQLIVSNHPSGVAHTFISPDGERTFATFLGAAADMQAYDLTPEMFDGYDYLYIEGYLVQNHDLILRAIELAKGNGLKLCLDLASYNIVEADHAFFEQILADAIDVVFANEEEAKAFTHCEAAEALEKLGALCEVAVVKLGCNGSILMYKGEKTFCPAIPVEKVVDTTGAGDFYAAGVMYGILQGWDMGRCTRMGSLLAGHVIRHIGTTLPTAVWDEIRATIHTL